MIWIASLGALLNLSLGFIGLLFPKRIGRILGISPIGSLGVSELRATYGGFFLCLGVACLATQSAQVYLVTGAAWCGAAMARLLSFGIDKSYSRENVAGLFIEATIGLMMLSAIFAF